jgi:tRNA-uridine 2-sulfurtransferase
MHRGNLVIVALSGGVDSAVAALLLAEAGYDVECLHMTNWEDDAYCEAAADFQDARRVCRDLGLVLHRVNFAAEYRNRVFDAFLHDLARGRTPNPDILCNREIKFGALRRYARRLGARWLATGHYARSRQQDGRHELWKGCDASKDQSYFLHALDAADLADVLFPLGEMRKHEVRDRARRARLVVADKKDSTGICFIGERPFAEFLSRYLPATPGEIRALDGETVGTHRGLAYYTIGQRQGLGIGGRRSGSEDPWYVVGKDLERNELTVAQGENHPALYRDSLRAAGVHWIGDAPRRWHCGRPLALHAKIRYRQPDQACTVLRTGADEAEVRFEQAQRAVTPGQYVVFYEGARCLGGATIETAHAACTSLRTAV